MGSISSACLPQVRSPPAIPQRSDRPRGVIARVAEPAGMSAGHPPRSAAESPAQWPHSIGCPEEESPWPTVGLVRRVRTPPTAGAAASRITRSSADSAGRVTRKRKAAWPCGSARAWLSGRARLPCLAHPPAGGLHLSPMPWTSFDPRPHLGSVYQTRCAVLFLCDAPRGRQRA
jgi:hypothetical protein